MPPTDKQNWSPRFGTTTAVVAGMVLIYVLSMGPAWRMYGLEKISGKAVRRAYLPLWWLRDHNKTAGEIIDRYLDLWYDDPFNSITLKLGFARQTMDRTSR